MNLFKKKKGAVKMAVTRAWRVYGRDGHRQRVSFFDSTDDNFSRDGKTRIISTCNSDRTGTNQYSVVVITKDTAEECERELWGQITDGIFEDSRFGKVEEVSPKTLAFYGDIKKIYNMFWRVDLR